MKKTLTSSELQFEHTTAMEQERDLDQRHLAQVKAAKRRIEEERRLEEQRLKALAKKEELERRMAQRNQEQGRIETPHREIKEHIRIKQREPTERPREEARQPEKQQPLFERQQEDKRQPEDKYQLLERPVEPHEKQRMEKYHQPIDRKREDVVQQLFEKQQEKQDTQREGKHQSTNRQRESQQFVPPQVEEKKFTPSEKMVKTQTILQKDDVPSNEKSRNARKGIVKKTTQKYVVRERKLELQPKSQDHKEILPVLKETKQDSEDFKNKNLESSVENTEIRHSKPRHHENKKKDINDRSVIRARKENRDKEERGEIKTKMNISQPEQKQIKDQEFKGTMEREDLSREGTKKVKSSRFTKQTLRYVAKSKEILPKSDQKEITEKKEITEQKEQIEIIEQKEIEITEQKEQKAESLQASVQRDKYGRSKNKSVPNSKEKRPRVLYVPKAARKIEDQPREENPSTHKTKFNEQSLKMSEPRDVNTLRDDFPPPLASGVVLISEAQTGIEQSDVGDFIEIKSRRREKREQKEKEQREKKEKEKGKGSKKKGNKKKKGL